MANFADPDAERLNVALNAEKVGPGGWSHGWIRGPAPGSHEGLNALAGQLKDAGAETSGRSVSNAAAAVSRHDRPAARGHLENAEFFTRHEAPDRLTDVQRHLAAVGGRPTGTGAPAMGHRNTTVNDFIAAASSPSPLQWTAAH